MEIKNINIKEFRGLKDLDISFEHDGKVLDTIVLDGANGSGKTRILECIYDWFDKKYHGGLVDNEINLQYSSTEIEINKLDLSNSTLYANNIYQLIQNYINSKYTNTNFAENDKSIKNILRHYENQHKLPQIIYVPTEVNS